MVKALHKGDVLWAQALVILENMKEKYGLDFCGPATPKEAEKVVKRNKGYVLIKNNGYDYLPQNLESSVGVAKMGKRNIACDLSLYYGLTPTFTYQHYITFCREFSYRLNQMGKTKYPICEGDFPYEAGIFPTNSEAYSSGLDEEDDNTKKFQNQLNDQSEFM